MDNNNETKNDQINDSYFQEEGEYIINQKPKYKYEIKIIHDGNLDNEKNRIKSKTPNKIYPSSKLNILNKPKNNIITKKNNIINNNDNYNNNHYDYFNNYNNYNFYNSKPSKINQNTRQHSNDSIQPTASQINIISKTDNNFYKLKHYKKNEKYKNEYIYNNENIDSNKQCICEKEFSKIIRQYFGKQKIIKKNNYNINTVEVTGDHYMKNKKISKENICHNFNNKKKCFKSPLQIEKSIEKSYKGEKNVNTPNNKKSNNNNIYNNNMYIESSSSNRNHKNIIYNKNFYNKNINRDLYSNHYLYIKNKKIKTPEKMPENIKKIPSNHSFVSIDNSKNKNSPLYSSIHSRKDNSRIKLKNLSNINNSDDSNLSKNNRRLMIHKSSERKENIKTLPPGQIIKPLVVKKTVQKPVIETITKEDGTIQNVMRQTTIVTSIETKPITNLKKKKSNDSNLVKECITNIYITLTKNLDQNDEDDKKLIKHKSFDNINLDNKKYNNKINSNKEKKEVFIKRKITNKRIIKKNSSHITDNSQEIYYNKKHSNNISNNLKNNFNIDISEISNDYLKHKANNSSINNSSLISYEQIDPKNNVIRINEEVNYIKYLYYRCTNLDSTSKAKLETLSNYFLKLSDEEKIGILTNLNDGQDKNQKIYEKLINILNEKRLEEEKNSINERRKDFNDHIISDFEEDKKKKNKKTNILFKKKKIIK